MSCRICIRRNECKSITKTRVSGHKNCSRYKIPALKRRHPFNSKKYARNPRSRGYMLLKRTHEGIIEASVFGSWSSSYGHLLDNFPQVDDLYKSEFSLEASKAAFEKRAVEEIFIARANSARCPVTIDYIRIHPQRAEGVVYFSTKDRTDEYYKEILS